MANPFKSHPRVKNTDGRVPTTTIIAPKTKEGSTTARMIEQQGSSLGANKKGGNIDEGFVEKMINRNAQVFRNDIVKRQKSVQGRRSND